MRSPWSAARRLSTELKYHNLTQISSRQSTAKSDANSTSSDISSSKLIFKVQAQLELDEACGSQSNQS